MKKYLSSKRLRLLFPWLFLDSGRFLLASLSLDPNAMPSALIGQSFPVFDLPRLQDEQAVYEQLKGEVNLVNVWATWCMACKM